MTAKRTAKTTKNFENARDEMLAFSRKAGEMGQRSFHEYWQLGLKLQGQTFNAWEKQLDLFRTQVDFAIDNQKDALRLVKKQLEAMEDLCQQGIDEAAARMQSAYDIN